MILFELSYYALIETWFLKPNFDIPKLFVVWYVMFHSTILVYSTVLLFDLKPAGTQNIWSGAYEIGLQSFQVCFF
jgi:hypothetical protein